MPVLPVIFLTGGAQSARTTNRKLADSRQKVGAGIGAQVGAGASIRAGSAGVIKSGADADSVAVPTQQEASRWRPYLVIAGLVTSFTLVTLIGSVLLTVLNLPQDIIRWVAMVVLILIGIGLIVPKFEYILEKPFAFILPQKLQTLLPDYTAGVQEQLTDNDSARDALSMGGLVNDENKDLDKCDDGASELQFCGIAPSIKGIDSWLNTPDGEGIDLKDLRGQVTLVDFWAYSCINCQRSIPHVVGWDKAYRDAGLNVIGIHSPEYAFEKDASNVAAGAKDFGITYPVALDNNLSTWTNYRNRYWPAHYLIDADGVVRHIAFGEGNYATTEKLIRELLADANPGVDLPAPTDTVDDTPELGATTRETFLGSSKDVNFAGPDRYAPGEGSYDFPSDQGDDTFALDGDWDISTQYVTPTAADAGVRLSFHATVVEMVLAGTGQVTVTLDDGSAKVIDVDGTPKSYPLAPDVGEGQHVLDVQVGEGVEAYSFTFG